MSKKHIAQSGQNSGQWVTCKAGIKECKFGSHTDTETLKKAQFLIEEKTNNKVKIGEVPLDAIKQINNFSDEEKQNFEHKWENNIKNKEPHKNKKRESTELSKKFTDNMMIAIDRGQALSLESNQISKNQNFDPSGNIIIKDDGTVFYPEDKSMSNLQREKIFNFYVDLTNALNSKNKETCLEKLNAINTNDGNDSFNNYTSKIVQTMSAHVKRTYKWKKRNRSRFVKKFDGYSHDVKNQERLGAHNFREALLWEERQSKTFISKIKKRLFK